MNIIKSISDFVQIAPEFASSYCIINGAPLCLEDVQNMGYDEFSLRSKLNMPLKLYRYYPNKECKDEKTKETVNYSIQALENNTVFLQTPTEFDDVYDSDITIDYQEYERLRLIEYCRRCGVNMPNSSTISESGDVLVKNAWNYILDNKNLEGFFTECADNEIENLDNQLFSQRILANLYENNDIGLAVKNALFKEYSDYVASLKTTFRTSCFSTTPYSQLMWGGAYADCHKGFCLEYTVMPKDKSYEDIYYNLFPMIYCKTRPDITSKLVAAKDKKLTKEDLWDIYFHGTLRKSIDWAFQNEWRLILPFSKQAISDYNVKFFPVTKVYLGNRMPPNKRKEIIDICHRKNIEYIGVKRNPRVYEMQDCEIKCEDCIEYKKSEATSNS